LIPLPKPEFDRLGFIGGTGPEGRGLALRFAARGYPVIVGSRSQNRAEEVAAEIRATLQEADAIGSSNHEAARAADILFLTIPYSGVHETLPSLAIEAGDKVVVSAIAPVEFQEGRPVGLVVQAGSAAEWVQELLPNSRVVSAFQTVDAQRLQDLESELDTDVIVCSDDVESRRAIVQLAAELPGIRALSGGRLSTSRYVEACTTLLIIMNRIYKAHTGLRLTGIDR
jgi:8-hydroxy-5-deazaflavin:NADPH oxidoreductase